MSSESGTSQSKAKAGDLTAQAGGHPTCYSPPEAPRLSLSNPGGFPQGGMVAVPRGCETLPGSNPTGLAPLHELLKEIRTLSIQESRVCKYLSFIHSAASDPPLQGPIMTSSLGMAGRGPGEHLIPDVSLSSRSESGVGAPAPGPHACTLASPCTH